MANNGGSIIGLHDELMSFFQATNIYVAGKKVSNENQTEFLSMFNCGEKRRETRFPN